jgi:hypothetical protein
MLALLCLAARGGGAQETGTGRTTRVAAIDGVVTDTALVPLVGATVSLMGTAIRVVTRERGQFRVTALPAGSYIVIASRIGYEPLSARVRLTGSDTERVSFSLERVTNALDTVRVLGDKPVLARYEEFETRLRNREATAAITEDDIRKRNPTQTWQMLTNISAMQVSDRQEHGELVVVASSRRGMVNSVIGPRGNAPCFMTLMIDGVEMPAEDAATGRVNLNRLPPPSEIHGIEIFAGGAVLPAKYSGAGAGKWCGLIAVWTK